MERNALYALATVLAAFLLLALTGTLEWAQHFARSPMWSLLSPLVFIRFLRYGRAGRALLMVCALWAAVVWSNLILASHQKRPATLVGVEAHIAVSNKDSNWAYAVFQCERGQMGEYFPISARQLIGGSVTLGIATGPFWPRIEYVNSESWSGSANLF